MRAAVVEVPGSYSRVFIKRIPIPKPASCQALVRVKFSSVNYIDCYRRSGLYPVSFPHTLGTEGAGHVVEPSGSFKAGDPVVWWKGSGSYAEYAAVDTADLLHVPEDIDLRVAAASVLQGLTAHYLVNDSFAVNQHHTCLVNAAAGGTGSLICQMAKLKGARVIGVVGSREKVSQVVGCDHVIVAEDVVEQVKALTDGAMVNVVYCGVGQSMFKTSLDCLRARGMMVSFGNASGPVEPIAPLELANRGSLTLQRPRLNDFVQTREELVKRADDLWQMISAGSLRVSIGLELSGDSSAEAHRLLEQRKTVGKVLLNWE